MRQVPMNTVDFTAAKNKKKLSLVTCYDYCFAKIIDETDIDAILVGDSLAMTMHGYNTTLPATVDLITLHVKAVARGITKKLIIGDLPFLSYRKGLRATMDAVEKIMQAGAHAVKLEGATDNPRLIKHIVNSGVPVMGHLGMTPQSIHHFGGFRVQGKNADAESNLIAQAKLLEDVGCFATVLECIPMHLAKIITATITIPTIGIGAGVHVDGQILVLQDLLGIFTEFKPKFVKTYLPGFDLIKEALNHYNNDVKNTQFPTDEYSYHN